MIFLMSSLLVYFENLKENKLVFFLFFKIVEEISLKLLTISFTGLLDCFGEIYKMSSNIYLPSLSKFVELFRRSHFF